ncbi:MAG: hypothetical protein IJ901_07950 [Bacteroidaceae bacterium]|nr:hypothetical protein [Bacteroidaceae bacterium]
MKNYWLLGAAALVFAACTSNDDFSSGKVEANLTSSSDYAFVKSNNGRIVNFSDLETPGTRAVSSAVINLLGVTSTMPEAPAVPSDAKSMVGVNGWEVQSGAKYFIPEGVTYEANMGLNGSEFYVQGTLNMSNYWNGTAWTGSGQVASKIYVLPGGTLNWNTDLPVQFNLYNYGELNINNSKKELYMDQTAGVLRNYGDLDLGDDINFRANRADVYIGGDVHCNNFWIEKDAKCYVAGDLILDTDLLVQQTLVVQGRVEAPNISLEAYTKFAAGCSVYTPGLFNINSNESEAWINYLKAGKVYSCATSKIHLADGSMIEVADTYMDENNSNNAVVILEGDNAKAVVKAKVIANNEGDGVTQILRSFRVEKPSTGSKLALDAEKFCFINNNHVVANELAKSNITVQEGVYIADEDLANFSMAPTDCAPGYNYNTPIVIVTPPVHKYSATSLDFGKNGELYLCWHSNVGNEVGGHGTNMYVSNEDGSSVSVDGLADWGGIIDVINTNNYGDPTTYLFDQTLIQNEHKYNHVVYFNDKLYLPSTSNKVGAALHEVALTSNGLIDEENFSSKNIRVNLTGSSANCCIINNGELITASGANSGAINKFALDDYSNQEKKAIVTGEDFYGKYVYNDGTYIITLNDVTNGTVSLYTQDMIFVKAFNVGAIAPTDGKNVCIGDGQKIYICRGANGFDVYDYNGNRVGGSKKKANGVDVDAKYIYIATGSGLAVLSQSETYTEGGVVYNKTVKRYGYFGIGNARYANLIEETEDTKQSSNFVKVRNNKAYVAYGMYGLQIYDLSELF